jgi:sugar phosphate isomerase/epimerase
MRSLSLHHLVASETTAVEFVGIAAGTGCEHVCLFTQDPGTTLYQFPIVQDGDVAELTGVMDDCGVSAYGVTSFGLAADVDVADFTAGLDRGARLGATVASVRIVDDDPARSTERFAEFCELAMAHGIRASIEYSGFSAANTLDRAMRIVVAAGHPNGAITLDALHVVRTDTPMAALHALDPAVIGYAQLCDGKLRATREEYQREGANDRLLPGEGEFPLDDILAAVPAGQTVSLEVPTDRLRNAGVSASERARLVVDATRKLLARERRA